MQGNDCSHSKSTVTGCSASHRIALLPNGTLKITNVTRRDAASYTCVAKNQFGTASTTGRLLITGESSLPFTEPCSRWLLLSNFIVLHSLSAVYHSDVGGVRFILMFETGSLKYHYDNSLCRLNLYHVSVRGKDVFRCGQSNEEEVININIWEIWNYMNNAVGLGPASTHNNVAYVANVDSLYPRYHSMSDTIFSHKCYRKYLAIILLLVVYLSSWHRPLPTLTNLNFLNDDTLA